MRIVQTFWSGGGNPLIKSFGWPHAEYNLMSWALSCCSLREHYDEVALYTDKQGYEVLIEKLNLPYTVYMMTTYAYHNIGHTQRLKHTPCRQNHFCMLTETFMSPSPSHKVSLKHR